MNKDLDESKNDTELEKKFNETYKLAMQEIDEQMKIARQAVNTACKISEKYGIPFYGSVTPLGQKYRPSSLEEKWGDDVNDLLESIGSYLPEYEGWQHSSVC